MILAFATQLGLLAQVTALATTAAPGATPIRVWLSDTTVTAGVRAPIYVHLTDPSYLTVLHVDPGGRMRVLFPLSPDGDAAVPGGATFEVGALVNADPGAGTILAARSRWPFQAAGLRTGSFWDYDNALLFQPTAGDPLAALLDIADRMAGGRPYDFDVTSYTVGRPLAARDPQLVTPVCLGCVRSRPIEQQSTVAVDQANTVDCSSAYLVDSFCGVIDNRVTNTYVYNEMAPASEPIYLPYYVPVFIVPRRRPVAPRPSAPPQHGVASVMTLRRTSGVVVPPQPRNKPVIRVQQPRQRYAPIALRQREEPDAGSATPAVVPRAAPAVPRYINRVSAGMPVRATMSWVPAPASVPAPAAAAAPQRAVHVSERHGGTMGVPMLRTRQLVPSGALLRAMTSRRP